MKTSQNENTGLNRYFGRIFSSFLFHPESNGTINTGVASMMSSFRHCFDEMKTIELPALAPSILSAYVTLKLLVKLREKKEILNMLSDCSKLK